VALKLEDAVIKLRRETGWGARKIRELLILEKDLRIPERTINRIIDRNGLITAEARIKPAIKRFQRDEPNQLWQMDFKGEYRDTTPFCFPLTLLDDHSRFSIGIYSLQGTKTELVDKSLIKAFETYGVPDAILTDHGSPWWSTHSEHGLTRLSINLIKQGIKLYYSGVGHPQTQGKIERFHRTLNQEVKHRGIPKSFQKWQSLFDEIRETYNTRRPHEALAMKVPASRYRPSKKQYTSDPKPWEYPSGSNVQTIDSAGCIRFKGQQRFISHALVGEKVRIDASEVDLIVSYRHMIIREVNMITGEGRPILIPQV
jgi:transposase InsO family protein